MQQPRHLAILPRAPPSFRLPQYRLSTCDGKRHGVPPSAETLKHRYHTHPCFFVFDGVATTRRRSWTAWCSAAPSFTARRGSPTATPPTPQLSLGGPSSSRYSTGVLVRACSCLFVLFLFVVRDLASRKFAGFRLFWSRVGARGRCAWLTQLHPPPGNNAVLTRPEIVSG